MRDVGSLAPPLKGRKHSGCMGCGAGCLSRLLLLLAFGCVIVIALAAVFFPWSFYLGGHFHWLPLWQGIGRIRTAKGDYVLYFWLEPTSGGRMYNLPNFRGHGLLCTPSGQRIQLRAYASLNEKTGLDTNGKKMSLGFRHRPWYWSFVGNYDARPQLTFRGQWQNPDLVMDDGGTFAVAFQPDGSLSNAHYNYYQSKAPNKQQVVFHEVQGFHGWWNDCRDK